MTYRYRAFGAIDIESAKGVGIDAKTRLAPKRAFQEDNKKTIGLMSDHTHTER